MRGGLYYWLGWAGRGGAVGHGCGFQLGQLLVCGGSRPPVLEEPGSRGCAGRGHSEEQILGEGGSASEEAEALLPAPGDFGLPTGLGAAGEAGPSQTGRGAALHGG